jgi:predicted MFS family arabinose efflux permease
MGLALAALLWFQVSAGERHAGELRGLAQGLRKIFTQKSAWMGLLFSLTILVANQLVNIMFGVWMETEFGLQIEQLGAASAVIGFAGILGVAMVALFTDKLGKRRAIGLGLLLNTAASVTLPLLGKTLSGAIITLFFFYLSFEFTLTSAISLMTELVPLARGTFVAANMAAISAGDSLGALAGTWLMHISLATNAFAAGLLDLIALLILIFFVETTTMDANFVPELPDEPVFPGPA